MISSPFAWVELLAGRCSRKTSEFFSEKASWAELCVGEQTLWGPGEILDHARPGINHSLKLRWLDPTLSGVYAIAYNRLTAFSNLPAFIFLTRDSPWTASISKWYEAH
jgi:hypothetical protein